HRAFEARQHGQLKLFRAGLVALKLPKAVHPLTMTHFSSSRTAHQNKYYRPRHRPNDEKTNAVRIPWGI
ncbi:MAG: hypothetical protein MUP33_02555, partial [Polaromonas sp.]|nr:hypothetical protein [Polaromonas sp.]